MTSYAQRGIYYVLLSSPAHREQGGQHKMCHQMFRSYSGTAQNMCSNKVHVLRAVYWKLTVVRVLLWQQHWSHPDPLIMPWIEDARFFFFFVARMLPSLWKKSVQIFQFGYCCWCSCFSLILLASLLTGFDVFCLFFLLQSTPTRQKKGKNTHIKPNVASV